jgi:hypothetical protein
VIGSAPRQRPTALGRGRGFAATVGWRARPGMLAPGCTPGRGLAILMVASGFLHIARWHARFEGGDRPGARVFCERD